MMKRTFLLLLTVLLSVGLLPGKVLATDYSDYSGNPVAFGLNLTDDHKRPTCEKPSGVTLSDYGTYYYDKNAYKAGDKVMYLTFDCGYENGNTPKILKALKDADVKAVFFVTEPFIKEHSDLVKQMKEEGHLVGNHTCTHPRLAEKSTAQVKKELTQCAKTMKKLTGYDMDPYMRPPEGVYSVRVMKIAQDLGYATMLWSLAIYDYDEENQPGAQYVVDKFNKHHFCGMMPLLHAISSSDAEALPDVISEMTDKGYRFGEVSEFAFSNPKDKKCVQIDMEKMNRK